MVPGIHAFGDSKRKTWMAGTSPAMTIRREHRDLFRADCAFCFSTVSSRR